MELETIRERLLDYINVADEQHLSDIYKLVEDSIPPADENKYDEATLNMFYERRENHLKGLSKSYTVEESMKMIRQSRS